MPFKTLIAGLLLTLALPAAHAADTPYPNRPIRLIVPFAPGGGADVTARIVAEATGKVLGQSIVVENKPGAGGTVGATTVSRATPDGYTLLYTTPGPQITNPYLMRSLPYDPERDLVPVSRLAVVPSVLVVGKQLPVDSVDGLIKYARAHPNEVRFASAGIGATSHLSGELFKRMADVQIDHIPYGGTGAALQDVLGGRVEMAIDSVAVYLPQIKSGAVKALGVTTPQELPMLPGVPPIAEQLAGFDASPVNYLSAPAGTPPAVIATLNQAVNKALDDPSVKQRMLDLGLLPSPSTPKEMADQIATERAKWKQVIEKSGARID